MKISNASKKVLASALSAAMVVAFAPTVAFGAQADANQKITVNYDFGAGTDTASGVQAKADLTKTYEVKSVDNEFYTDIEKAEAAAALKKAQADQKDVNKKYGAISKKNVGDVKTDAKGKALTSAGNAKVVKSETGATIYSDAKCTKAYKDDDAIDAGSTWYVIDTPAVLYTQEEIDAAKKAIADAAAAVKVAQDEVTKRNGVKKAGIAAAIELQSGDFLKVLSNNNDTDETNDDYAFVGWNVYYDANGNGIQDSGEAVTVDGSYADVSSSAIPAGATLTAKAVYNNKVLADLAPAFSNDTKQKKTVVTIATKAADAGIVRGAAKIAVQTPSATVTATSGSTAVPAEVGEYKVTYTDGNGVVIDTKAFKVGALELSAEESTFDTVTGETDAAGKDIQVASQTVFYVANESGAKKTYADILNAAYGTDVTPSKTGFKGYTDAAGQLVSFATDPSTHKSSFSGSAAVENGAVATKLTGFFGAKSLLSATAKDSAVTISMAGFKASEMADDAFMQGYTTAKSGKVKYYVALTDASGKVVAESADTDAKDGKTFAFDASSSAGASYVAKNLDAGTYTATLYKVTAANETTDKTTGIVSTTAGKMEAVASLSATVAGAAAPTWSYAASYKDSGEFKSGVLTLTNNAGDAYDVIYGSNVYDQTKGGINYTAVPSSDVVIYAAAKDRANANPKTDPQTSKKVTLYAGSTALSEVTAVANATNLLVAGETFSYYSKDAGVAAAIAAAKKSITDKGFAEGASAAAAWKADKLAAEKSILSAVAEVAKAELAKLNTPVVAADGSAKKLTDAAYAKAVKDVDDALAAFDANHDDDKANNVAAYVGTTDAGYVAAINNIVSSAVAGRTTFAKADVDAASPVTAALKAAKTADEAKDALTKYAALNANQKELVAKADIAAAEAIVKADEEAKAAQKVVDEQDQAAVNYCNSTKSKTVKASKKTKKTTKAYSVSWKSKKSESGAAVVYAKASGSKYVKVSKSGKATLKKAVKKGTYKAKVKVTCGNATRTVTAKFIVK